MKIASLVASLILIATPVFAKNAGPQMPKQFVGTWCPDKKELDSSRYLYSRRKDGCSSEDSFIGIDNNRVSINEEAKCRLLEVIQLSIGGTINKYLIHLSCRNGKDQWPMQLSLTPADHGTIFVEDVTQEAKK